MLHFTYWLLVLNVIILGSYTLSFRMRSRWKFVLRLPWSTMYLWLDPWLNIIGLGPMMMVRSCLFSLGWTHFIVNLFLVWTLFYTVTNSSLNLTVNEIFKLVLFLNPFTRRYLIDIMMVIGWLKNSLVVLKKFIHILLCNILVCLLYLFCTALVILVSSMLLLFWENLL